MFYAHSTITVIRAKEKGDRGYGGGGRGRLYTSRYTVTTRMTPALGWAVMRAILMFHELWGTKSQESVLRLQLLKRKESWSRFEPRSLCLPAWRLTARPNQLTHDARTLILYCYIYWSPENNSAFQPVLHGTVQRNHIHSDSIDHSLISCMQTHSHSADHLFLHSVITTGACYHTTTC